VYYLLLLLCAFLSGVFARVESEPYTNFQDQEFEFEEHPPAEGKCP